MLSYLRTFYLSTVFFLLCLGSAAGAHGASFEEQCQNRLPPSVISVQSEPSHVLYDFTKSVAELSALKSYHSIKGVTLGLTKVELRTEVKWNWN